MDLIEPAPAAPRQQAEPLAGRIQVLRQAIGDGRGVATQIALLERQDSEAEAELGRGRAKVTEASVAVGGEAAGAEYKQEGAVVTLKLRGTVVVNEGEAMEVKTRFA